MKPGQSYRDLKKSDDKVGKLWEEQSSYNAPSPEHLWCRRCRQPHPPLENGPWKGEIKAVFEHNSAGIQAAIKSGLNMKNHNVRREGNSTIVFKGEKPKTAAEKAHFDVALMHHHGGRYVVNQYKGPHVHKGKEYQPNKDDV